MQLRDADISFCRWVEANESGRSDEELMRVLTRGPRAYLRVIFLNLRAMLLAPGFMLLAASTTLHAQFYALQTRDLRLVYYSKAHEYVVPHLARCFENALAFHHRLFEYTPSEKVTLLLQDFGDYASGGANTVPFNLIGIGIAPFSYTYETMPPAERMSMMMNHELAHIATMDKPSSSDRWFRSLFMGKVAPIAEAPPSMLYAYLTSPRWESPRWFIEGIAVFMETWMGGGLGRALGAYDEMVFRTMARDGSYFYDIVGLESEGTKVDFQVGANSYLYGTRFVSYLALLQGPEKVLQWFSQSAKSKRYYAAQFKSVYGLSLDRAWSNWIEWERQWQRTNLDSVRLHPVTPFRSLSRAALGSVSRAFYDASGRRLYAAINYPGQTADLAAIDIDTGALKKLHEVRGAGLFYVSSLAYDPSSGNLFFTTDNNYWRDLNALDLKTGRTRTLLKNVRTGDLAFNQSDRSLWGVRHFNGISTLVRIPYPYTEWNQVYSWDYGRDLFDVDVSPDGSSLTAALTEIDGRQLLIKMDIAGLLQGDTSYETLYDFENSTPANFVFSSDGRYLFGTSYYSGISNVVRYEVSTKRVEWISNCETGFFRPVPISDDSLIVFHYSGKGFQPVIIANQPVEQVSAIRYLGQAVVETHPALKSWTLRPPSPSTVPLDSLTISNGVYRPMRDISLASAYPIVEGYKDVPAYGVRMNLSDPLMLHRLDLTASYTPNRVLPEKERLHLGFNYSFWQWRLSATYNGADFYDLFGPTKTSRKGYSLALQYKHYLMFEEPKTMDYTAGVAYYGDLERLPDFQNVATTFDRFATVNGRLNYQYLRRSLGAADEDEKGVRWQAQTQNYIVDGKLFAHLLTHFDYGTLLPIAHSSIWLRTSAGFSFGNRREPFANFYFGGFGNNWVDHLAEKRYREYYSFPGVELNAISGTNYGKLLVEWTLPPYRFRRLGFPAVYCNWARSALFVSTLKTNFDAPSAARSLLNFGGQIDFRIVLLSHLSTTLSVGYAMAMEADRRPRRESMISLKIL